MSWSSICLSDLVVGDAIRRLRSRQPLLSRAHIIPITTIDIDINLVGNSLLVVDPTRSNRKLTQRAVRKRVNAPRSDRRVGVQTISRATCFGSAIRRRSWKIVPNRPSQTVLASAQPDSARRRACQQVSKAQSPSQSTRPAWYTHARMPSFHLAAPSTGRTPIGTCGGTPCDN